MNEELYKKFILENKNLNHLQKYEVRKGLQRDIDIIVYAKPEYNVDQMVEIR